VLGDGDDVGASNLGDSNTAVGLVRGIEVDVVRSNTSSNGKLQVLSLGQTLGGKVTWVETVDRDLLADVRSDGVGSVSASA
jgi:hypothetical protein